MDERLEFSIRCALESGKIQRKYFQKEIGIHYKGEINLVTNVDLACQERIIDMIKERFPGDEIISEEKHNRLTDKRDRWIIDPLDGTTNYAHGYPFFCTSIGYEVDGVIAVGVIYNPIFDELFFAKRGMGAYLNGQRIRVSNIKDIKKALLCTGFPYDLSTNKRNNIDHFVRFLFNAQAVRRDGSAALNLSYLACGRFDGYWELSLNPWDMSAGALMVVEAGGRITDFDGKVFSIYQDEVVASNGLLHDEMLRVLHEKG